MAHEMIYRDPGAGVEARVRDLLGRMTPEEKIAQMALARFDQVMSDGRVSGAALAAALGDRGIGCFEDLRADPRTNAEAVNAVQQYLVEHTRLGIPAMVISECLHGHMSGKATVFPQAIALASTWDPELVRQMAEVTAREARATGVAQALSPDLDLARDPRWGRVEETYGEDPYLVERMGVAFIQGMQGPGPGVDREHLVCTAKHYAAHGSPEAGMNLSPVACGPRELRTLYLPPFKAAVQEAGILSVMPAYSELDGVPAHASKLLLTDILREEWGFEGYTFSDYGGIQMLHSFHRTAHDAAEAGRQALSAGCDLEAPVTYGYGPELLRALQNGSVPVELVDQAVSRILRVKFLAGLFEAPYAAPAAAAAINCSEHRALARRLAQESIVLLKNEGDLLPLDPGLSRIAVIGPNADVVQQGGYSKPKPDAVSPLQGIRNAVSDRTDVVSVQGCGLYNLSHDGFAEAADAARDSDVAVVVIGGASIMAGVGWGGSSNVATCGEGFDRTELGPPGAQEDLVKAVVATGTPTVVVLVHGRPYSIPWMARNVPSILDAWYPGEEGGNAIADILFGSINPSGKLPISVPRSVGHVPAFYNHKPSARGYYHKPGAPGAPGRDYVFAGPEPLYPFGHGLSYTTFAYTDLRLAPDRIQPDGHVDVSVNVRNTGERAGQEVVQLYLSDVTSSVTTPVRSLRRFRKIALDPGEQQSVSFELLPHDLQLLDGDMNWVVEPGEFEITVADLRCTFEVVPAAAGS